MTPGDRPFNPGEGGAQRPLRSPFLKGQQLAFCARCGAELDATGCVDCGWVPPAKASLGTGISGGLIAGSCALVLAVFGGLYLMARINIHNWYPDEAKAKEHMRIAHVKYEEGATEETFVECDQALTYAPRNALLRMEFAQLLEKEGQHDQALDQITIAAQLAPANKDVLETNASMFDRLSSDEKETLSRYEAVLKKHPKSSVALFWGARTCERLGNYPRAQELYLRELEVDKSVDGTWCGLSRAYGHQNKPEKAIETLRKGIVAVPESSALHYELALLLVERKQKAEAISEFKKSIELDPSTGEWTSEIISKLNTAKEGTFVMVPLEQQGDSFMVNVLLNGNIRAKLIVDSGAESCVISNAMAERLKLRMDNAEPIAIASATGYGAAYKVPLDSVAVGNAKQSGVPFNIMDMPMESGADGLLGMSFLKRYKFSLDAKHQLLQLQSKD